MEKILSEFINQPILGKNINKLLSLNIDPNELYIFNTINNSNVIKINGFDKICIELYKDKRFKQFNLVNIAFQTLEQAVMYKINPVFKTLVDNHNIDYVKYIQNKEEFIYNYNITLYICNFETIISNNSIDDNITFTKQKYSENDFMNINIYNIFGKYFLSLNENLPDIKAKTRNKPILYGDFNNKIEFTNDNFLEISENIQKYAFELLELLKDKILLQIKEITYNKNILIRDKYKNNEYYIESYNEDPIIHIFNFNNIIKVKNIKIKLKEDLKEDYNYNYFDNILTKNVDDLYYYLLHNNKEDLDILIKGRDYLSQWLSSPGAHKEFLKILYKGDDYNHKYYELEAKMIDDVRKVSNLKYFSNTIDDNMKIIYRGVNNNIYIPKIGIWMNTNLMSTTNDIDVALRFCGNAGIIYRIFMPKMSIYIDTLIDGESEILFRDGNLFYVFSIQKQMLYCPNEKSFISNIIVDMLYIHRLENNMLPNLF